MITTTTAPAPAARALGVLDLVIVTPAATPDCRPFYGEIVAVRPGAYRVSYRCGRSCEWFDAAQVAPRPRRNIC